MALLSTLPKAELHLHVEGTLEPELAFTLADRNRVRLPFVSVEQMRDVYHFDSLQSFLNLYYELVAVLQTARDFHDLAQAYLRRAHAQGVRHVEMFFDPQVHTSRGVAFDAVVDGLVAAFTEAAREHGMTGGLIPCVVRDRSVAEAMALVEQIAHRRSDILGIGLDSAERGYPPELFTEVFARAGELGLHRVAHAGEEGPAAYVWSALDNLRVERIDHGIRSMEDPLLVERLRDHAVPLTVCPLSNVRLACVPNLAAHPLPGMLEAGLKVTVNSDDPAYFGGYVCDNFEALRLAVSLSDEQAAQLARNSVTASFASPERKAALLSEIDQWLTGQ